MFSSKSALAAIVAALAVSAAAAADGSRKTLELTADAASAEMELGFDGEGARRRALQGEYASGNVIEPETAAETVVEIIERRGGGGGSY